MISSEILRVVLGGSYRKDRAALERAYHELATNGCQILSPHRMAFDDEVFTRDDAETDLTVRQIEEHHLLALKQSHFMWLHAPAGYVGVSAAFEIGYARAIGVPVFSRDVMPDPLLAEYVQTVASVYDAKMLLL